MTASIKMHQLESKIANLQNQYQHLLSQRQQDIATLITSLDLASLEDPLLVGSLLYIKDKVTTKDPIMEGWHNAGERFLRKQKPKKHLPSQRPSTPLPTDQPLKKLPHAREKKDEATTVF